MEESAVGRDRERPNVGPGQAFTERQPTASAIARSMHALTGARVQSVGPCRIGDRDIAVLEAAVGTLSAFGMVSGHPLDVADAESFGTFMAKARADGGGHIDVLINNAGVMPVGPFLAQS